MKTHDEYLTWDAAYVLGSLTSAERREYEEHLADCTQCGPAVSELSGMPALLALLTAEEAGAALGVPAGGAPAPAPVAPAPIDSELSGPEPSAEVLDLVLHQVRRQRRNRWITTAVASLAAAALAVGIVLVARPGHSYPETPTAQMQEMVKVSDTPINASIALSSFGWGTRIDMACTYGDWGQRDNPPQDLGMVVVGRDGNHTQVATWLGVSGATALPSANVPKPVADIAAVQLVSVPDGKVLLEKNL